MVGGLEDSSQLPLTLHSVFGCFWCSSTPSLGLRTLLGFRTGGFLLTLETQSRREMEMKEIKQGTGGIVSLHLACLENIFDFRELFVVSCGLELKFCCDYSCL